MKPVVRNTEASEQETTGLHARKHPRLTMAAMLLGLLAAGAALAWWAAARADRAMRADLLRQTQMVAQAVNVDFTTKPEGNDLGLHSFAVFLSAYNGQISVDSPGANQGATVTVGVNHA